MTDGLMDNALVALPVGIPWLTAVLVAFLDGRKRWVGWLAAAGLAGGLASLVLLTAATLRRGTLTTTAGGWRVQAAIPRPARPTQNPTGADAPKREVTG